jgi:hypothetical protein
VCSRLVGGLRLWQYECSDTAGSGQRSRSSTVTDAITIAGAQSKPFSFACTITGTDAFAWPRAGTGDVFGVRRVPRRAG